MRSQPLILKFFIVFSCILLFPHFSLAQTPQTEVITSSNAQQMSEIGTITIETNLPRLNINAIAFSPDGQTIATAADNDLIELRDIETLEITKIYESEDYNYSQSLAYSPDGSILAAGELARVRLWDTENDVEVSKWETEDGMMFDLAYSPDGTKLVAANGVGDVWVWDAESGDVLAQLSGATNLYTAVAVRPDGQTFAGSSWDNHIRVWDMESMELDLDIYYQNDLLAVSVAFSPDSSIIATGWEGVIQFQDANTGEVLSSHKFERGSDGFDADPWDIAFSPDGSILAVAISYDQIPAPIILIDVATGTEIVKLEGHQQGVQVVTFNQDGTLLASGSPDHTIRLWGIPTSDS